MGDLDKLIAAVEAGGFDASAERNVPRFNAFADAFEAALGMRPSYADGWRAYRGSIDAALRLHEALLPGYTRSVDATVPEMGILVEIWSPSGPIVGVGDNVCEARAWLLGILRALQAQSTPPISPEAAQFNAVRHHERFGPLDEKGNPLDPRRRG